MPPRPGPFARSGGGPHDVGGLLPDLLPGGSRPEPPVLPGGQHPLPPAPRPGTPRRALRRPWRSRRRALPRLEPVTDQLRDRHRVPRLVRGHGLPDVTLLRRLAPPRARGGERERARGRGGHLLVRRQRSEEHTSELLSRSDLVCRLLLEKKKKTVVLSVVKTLLCYIVR